MGKPRGRGFFGWMKAKIKRYPIAPTTATDNPNTTPPDPRATDPTLSDSAPIDAHTVDEPPQPSIAIVSSTPSPDDEDPGLSSSTILVDTGDELPSDCLPQSSEDNTLWQKAYNAATPKTKKWIGGLLKPNGMLKSAETTQTEELIEIVRDIEKRHRDHALQIPIGGKQILWRDYAPRVRSFIEAIGDIAIQFAPAPSGIIWSTLKTLLQVLAHSKILIPATILHSLSNRLQISIAPGEEFAAILGCSEKVLSIVRRGKVYEVIYLNSANTFVPVQEDLERSLVDAYTKSLDLLAHVGQRLAEGYRHILLAIVNPGEAEGLMASIIQCENDLIKAAQTCEAIRRVNVDERLNTILNSLSEPLAQINDRVYDLLEVTRGNELLNALEYFSHIDFGDQHRIKAELRTPGTGEWLLQHKKFQEWEHIPASTILWLQGTGK